MMTDIHSLVPSALEPFFDLATETFVRRSTLHRALGVGLEEYRPYLRPAFEAMVEQGLSIAATDGETGEPIGCLIVTDYRFSAPGVTLPRLAPLGALTAALRRKYECRHHPSPGEAILVDMAAVTEAATGQGIYCRMRRAACDVARAKGFRHVVGEASSSETQHVLLDCLGHQKMAEIAFCDFSFANEMPFASIENPPTFILAEGDL